MFTLSTSRRTTVLSGSLGTRRAFLYAGAIPGLGLSLPMLSTAPAGEGEQGANGFGRARRCVLLFLSGGTSQHDTWDPKPDAPDEIRGELQSIATSVTGVRFGELFPRTAEFAHRCCVMRSLAHADTLHTVAGYQMLTGFVHPTAGQGGSSVDRRPLPTDHPHLGSLLLKSRPAQRGVPTFAALPEVLTDGGITPYPGQFGGLLGRRFDPLSLQGDIRTGKFLTPDVVLPAEVDGRRLFDRRHLLFQLDQQRSQAERGGALAEYGDFRQRAFEMVGSPGVQAAFHLDREPPAVRESYGPHLFGRSCLLARRLLEAGVSLVSVYWPQDDSTKDSPVWDTHEDQVGNLRRRLAPFGDAAIASLLHDLDERGLLDDTLFVCLSEFGRTPKITNQGSRQGGREHWPFVFSILLAGAGIPGGTIYGASDAIGAYPAERPVPPSDLAATLLHLLGVPHRLEITDPLGRPFPASTGEPITALWS